jgi:hypothetical protein
LVHLPTSILFTYRSLETKTDPQKVGFTIGSPPPR